MIKINPFTGKLDLVGNEISSFPDYPVGTRQTFLESGYVVTTSFAMVVNTLLGYFIRIEKDTNIASLRLQLATTAVGNSIFGVYDLLDGYPTDLLFSGAPFDNNVGGNSDATINQTISEGFYFVAYNSSSANAAVSWFGNLYNSMLGAPTSINGGRTGYSIARVYDGTLPTTFPAGATFATSVMPAITFLIQ